MQMLDVVDHRFVIQLNSAFAFENVIIFQQCLKLESTRDTRDRFPLNKECCQTGRGVCLVEGAVNFKCLRCVKIRLSEVSTFDCVGQRGCVVVKVKTRTKRRARRERQI